MEEIDRFASIRKAPPAGQPSRFEEPPPAASAAPADQADQDSASRADNWRKLSSQLALEHGFSAPWADGLAAMQLMPTPAGAGEARWAQIVSDALWFAVSWHGAAEAHGWTINDVFGCDLDDETGSLGLVVEIRGGRVVLIDNQEATIRNGATRSIYRKGTAAKAEPIWTLGKRKKGKRK